MARVHLLDGDGDEHLAAASLVIPYAFDARTPAASICSQMAELLRKLEM